jgi:superfamily II DNA or RNA helicase
MKKPPSPTVFYNEQNIREWINPSTLSKSYAYVNAVSALRWEQLALCGKVKGTARRPYEVYVDFDETGGEMWAEGTCSCPVGIDCKHVGALLLAGLETMPPTKPGPDPKLVRWLEDFRARCGAAESKRKKAASKPAYVLLYQLSWLEYRNCHLIKLFKVRFGSEAAERTVREEWRNVEAALIKPPQFVADADLAILRRLWLTRSSDYDVHFTLRGEAGAELLEKMVATGRLYAGQMGHSQLSPVRQPLRLADARPGEVHWQAQPDGRLRPVLDTEPSAAVVASIEPAWYIDTQSCEAGLVQLPLPLQSLPPQRLTDYLAMPPITLADAPVVAAVLRDVVPELPPPPAPDASALRTIDCDPAPVLLLDTRSALMSTSGLYSYQPNPQDFATVHFEYDTVRVDAFSSATLFPAPNHGMVQVRRRADAEARRLVELREAGLHRTDVDHWRQALAQPIFMPRKADDWNAFIQIAVPALQRRGWRIVMTPDCRFNVIDIDGIDGIARHAGDGWFDLELGISVNGRTVRLEPLLVELFQRDHRWLGGQLEAIADDEAIELRTGSGEKLRLHAKRLKPVVGMLVDLFDSADTGALRVSAFDAGRLADLASTGRWEFHGDASVRDLAQRLRDGPGLGQVAPPRGLKTTLRAYQLEGLSWMQFLREHGLAGVLADDMGLGKTVQTLAHVLAEKEAGRLDRPALIVVPTTLVHNWREEARRFAPDLKVLDLNGAQRKERFGQVAGNDMVLTTYALLWRDQAELAAHDYHLLILDEAQYVKNAASRGAAVIRELRARHRLCLTGTPLENHLGELWAQFDFLLPGFLGSQKDFTKRWRTPIEKGNDNVRRELLARRIRPFMLRRRKDEVAAELPPKTIMVRNVELDGAQRDLYESVRTAMQKKVRGAIAAHGLARSHIIVLEALLKLRQVCCHPRLVRLARAAQAGPSAKLDLLMTMLPELMDEGRRVLLFSQFTGMLALIADALNKAGLPYVMLTGDTSDRITPVRRFQQGEVRLFLISLKAGGVGLNLTAADTVIHYDPWWNPAAENQATDRAHRLGQTKPVFVYKLIVAGSIEEKIVALQQKKAVLADSILSGDSAGVAKFSADDIDALFAPMPPVSSRAMEMARK